MSGYRQFCGLARALDAIGDRWNLLIVRELLIAPRRHCELRAALPGMATNLLSDRLRHLAGFGILTRREEQGHKAVVYALTPFGERLREPVEGLIRWASPLMAAGPRPDDTIQPHWLLLAVQALLKGRTFPRTGTIRIITGDARFTLHLSREGARVIAGAEPTPDAVLDAAPGVVLGIIAGAIPLASATARVNRISDEQGLLAGALTPTKDQP